MIDQSSSLLHTVWIPPLHRDLTQGAERVIASGATIRAVLADLDTHFPGIAARMRRSLQRCWRQTRSQQRTLEIT